MKTNCEHCKAYWQDVLRLVWGKDAKKELSDVELFCPMCGGLYEAVQRDARVHREQG